MTSFEERREMGYAVKANSKADVREIIAWCRANIGPNSNGLIVSACLWSVSQGNCRITSHCWCSIRAHDTDELAEYLTPESLKLYNGIVTSTFAFHNKEDATLFALRWQ